MGIWAFCQFTSKWRHTLKFFMNFNSGAKNSPMCQIWAWSSNYLENNPSFFVFSTQKMTWHTGNKRLLWQHLTTMVIDKISKMSVKGVKLKSESFFSISPGVFELWRKNLRGGGGSPPPGPDRVKARIVSEHFGGNKIKIYKGGHMIELWQTLQHQVLSQDDIFITIYHQRRVYIVDQGPSASRDWSLLLLGLLLCFTPLLLLVFLYHGHYQQTFMESLLLWSLITSTRRQLREPYNLCLHSSSETIIK